MQNGSGSCDAPARNDNEDYIENQLHRPCAEELIHDITGPSHVTYAAYS